MTQSSRPPLWYFFPLIALAIFLNKPFHIDDTLFLNIGRILPWSILGDSMGDISFLGRVYQDLSPYESTHPPLIPYFLKLIGAGFDQYAPFWLYHLFFLVFPFLVLVEGWNLSKRKNVSPVWTWFLVFSPLFFVNATNLMTDIAMLCFWLGGIASIIAFCEDGTRKHALKAMGYLTGAFFTSYQSICLVPLLILYILVNGERKRRSLLLLAAPTVVFFVYLFIVYLISGFFPFLASTIDYNIGSEVASGMNLENFLHKTIGVLVFSGLGLAFPTPLLLASLNRRRFLEYVVFGSIISFTFFHLGDSFQMFEGYTELETTVIRLFILIGGIWLFFLLAKLIDGLRILARSPRRASNHLLLTFWFFGVLAFNILFLPYATARYLLPALPAAIFLLYIRPRFKVNQGIQQALNGALLTLLAIVSMLMAAVDFQQADSDWVLFKDVQDRVGQMDRLWYSDDAGLALYLGDSGARYLAEDVDDLPVGDFVLLTRGLISGPLQQTLSPIKTYRFPGFLGLSLFNTQAHAGFYRSFDGFLPIAFANEVRHAVLLQVNPFLKYFDQVERIQLSSPNYAQVAGCYDQQDNLVRGINMHPDAEIAFPVEHRGKQIFRGSIFIPHTSWGKEGDGVAFQVGVRREGEVQWIWERFLDPANVETERTGVPFELNLPDGTQAIHLKVGPGPKGDYRNDSVFWLFLELESIPNDENGDP